MTTRGGSSRVTPGGKEPIKVLGKESHRSSLPKRFYKLATVGSCPSPRSRGEGRGEGQPLAHVQEPAPHALDAAPHPNPLPMPPPAWGEGTARRPAFRILLDGRSVKTPMKLALAVPTEALAAAIAAEWNAQGATIDPETMPLTRLANTAIDAVAAAMSEVAADIVQYSGSDLLCYRAAGPVPLVAAQALHWDPVLDWIETTFGATFTIAEGLMPIAQPRAALDKIATALRPYDAYALSGLHVMTTLSGSALLALAHAKGHLALEEAWAAAHVDDDFQIKNWGPDSEAEARRQRRFAEFQTASRFFSLLGKPVNSD